MTEPYSRSEGFSTFRLQKLPKPFTCFKKSSCSIYSVSSSPYFDIVSVTHVWTISLIKIWCRVAMGLREVSLAPRPPFRDRKYLTQNPEERCNRQKGMSQNFAGMPSSFVSVKWDAKTSLFPSNFVDYLRSCLAAHWPSIHQPGVQGERPSRADQKLKQEKWTSRYGVFRDLNFVLFFVEFWLILSCDYRFHHCFWLPECQCQAR